MRNLPSHMCPLPPVAAAGLCYCNKWGTNRMARGRGCCYCCRRVHSSTGIHLTSARTTTHGTLCTKTQKKKINKTVIQTTIGAAQHTIIKKKPSREKHWSTTLDGWTKHNVVDCDLTWTAVATLHPHPNAVHKRLAIVWSFGKRPPPPPAHHRTKTANTQPPPLVLRRKKRQIGNWHETIWQFEGWLTTIANAYHWKITLPTTVDSLFFF